MARILVVDDSQFVRTRNVSVLQGLGHETLEASDGKEAVNIFEQEMPDAVLMDITMPVMDGLQALQEIKMLHPDAKIAMVTATGQRGVVIEAIKSGADDFVVKPIDAGRVKATLDKILD